MELSQIPVPILSKVAAVCPINDRYSLRRCSRLCREAVDEAHTRIDELIVSLDAMDDDGFIKWSVYECPTRTSATYTFDRHRGCVTVDYETAERIPNDEEPIWNTTRSGTICIDDGRTVAEIALKDFRSIVRKCVEVKEFNVRIGFMNVYVNSDRRDLVNFLEMKRTTLQGLAETPAIIGRKLKVDHLHLSWLGSNYHKDFIPVFRLVDAKYLSTLQFTPQCRDYGSYSQYIDLTQINIWEHYHRPSKLVLSEFLTKAAMETWWNFKEIEITVYNFTIPMLERLLQHYFELDGFRKAIIFLYGVGRKDAKRFLRSSNRRTIMRSADGQKAMNVEWQRERDGQRFTFTPI